MKIIEEFRLNRDRRIDDCTEHSIAKFMAILDILQRQQDSFDALKAKIAKLEGDQGG